MFYKKENPQLFYYVVREVSKLDKSVDNIMTQSLTDEQLAKVTNIKITPIPFKEMNLQTLSGIEKLPNLEHFSVQGMSISQYYGKANTLSKINSTGVEYEVHDLEATFNACQLKAEDMEYLKFLPKLKTLNLSHQRNITELDVSSNPKLVNINCTGADSLTKVTGLQGLDCLNGNQPENSDDIDFQFTECPLLEEIGDPDKLFQQVFEVTDSSLPKLHFHTSTYAKLTLQARETGSKFAEILDKQERDALQIAEWVESGCGSFRASHNSGQMRMITDRITNIIRTVCADNPSSDIEKVSRWYRWISDNCKYDQTGLDKEEQKIGSQASQKRNTNNIRSSFHTLWNRMGVCAGIANLYNYGVNLMDYSSKPLYCRGSKVKEGEDARLVVPDHEASELFLSDGTPLFFDPTWDLGKSQSHYFGLTKEEFCQTHALPIDFIDKGRKLDSMQPQYASLGCLSTVDVSKLKNPGSEVAR